jgi:hypothetical protein
MLMSMDPDRFKNPKLKKKTGGQAPVAPVASAGAGAGAGDSSFAAGAQPPMMLDPSVLGQAELVGMLTQVDPSLAGAGAAPSADATPTDANLAELNATLTA